MAPLKRRPDIKPDSLPIYGQPFKNSKQRHNEVSVEDAFELDIMQQSGDERGLNHTPCWKFADNCGTSKMTETNYSDAQTNSVAMPSNAKVNLHSKGEYI